MKSIHPLLFLKKIVNLKFILFLIFLLTVIYFIINPRFIYEKGQYFNTSYHEIDYATQFATLPNDSEFDIIYINERNTCTYINYYSIEKNEILKKRIYNFSTSTLLGELLSECYYDTLKNKLLTILTTNNSDYFLFELFNNRNPIEIKKEKIFHYSIYDSLHENNIVVNNITFNSFEVEDNLDELCELTPDKNGFRLTVSGLVRDTILPQNESINLDNKIYYKLGEIISNFLKTPFTKEDVFKIIQFFLRRNYYNSHYFRRNLQNSGFMPAKILGSADINQDGNEELFIIIYGYEYIYNLLICYDTTAKSILWENRYYRKPEKFIIQDIDNDKNEEIIIGFTHSEYNLPVEWFTKKLNCYNEGNIVILNNNGTCKFINNRPAILNLQGESVSTYLNLDSSNNKILVGCNSKKESSNSRFIIWDLIENNIDSLNVLCNNFIGFCRNKNNISAFSCCREKLVKRLFSSNLKLEKTTNRKIGEKVYFIADQSIKILNRKYYLSVPLLIISEDLKLVYKCPYNAVKNHISIANNNLFFIEQRRGLSYLSRINFIENRKLNPYAILAISIEIIILIFSFFVINFISFPISSGTNSYLIVISVINKVHFWKIYGKMKVIYKLPKHLSLNRNIYLNIVRSLSNNNYKVVYNKKNFIFNYTVYELSSRDELIIIRHIVHELKNKILLIRMMIHDKDKIDSETNNFPILLDYISKIVVTLSHLTRIDTLYKEKTELNQFFKLILSEYVNHPKFKKIDFKSGISNKYFLIDKLLFGIAFKNLLNNALESIKKNNEHITINVSIIDEKLNINIINPGHIDESEVKKLYEIGYTTKNEGSGLGIPISKIIIEKHNGIFNILCKNRTIIARIILPKELFLIKGSNIHA